MVQLSPNDRAELDRLEKVIQRGLVEFLDVGAALITIRDFRFYRASHRTFKDYVKERWGWQGANAHRQIQAAMVAIDLSANGQPPPANERQARELAKLADPEQRAAAWAKAVSTAPKGADGQSKVTSAHVARVVSEFRLAGQPAGPATSNDPRDHLALPIPEGLLPVFGASDVDSVLRALRTAKRLLAKVSASLVFTDLPAVAAAIERGIKLLRAGQPFTTCPSCAGGGCPTCRQSGFLPRGPYEALPDSIKAPHESPKG